MRRGERSGIAAGSGKLKEESGDPERDVLNFYFLPRLSDIPPFHHGQEGQSWQEPTGQVLSLGEGDGLPFPICFQADPAQSPLSVPAESPSLAGPVCCARGMVRNTCHRLLLVAAFCVLSCDGFQFHCGRGIPNPGPLGGRFLS